MNIITLQRQFVLALFIFLTLFEVIAQERFFDKGVQGLLEDEQGFIWAFGDNRIVRFGATTHLEMGEIGAHIKLPITSVSAATHYQNKLLFADYKNGLVLVDPVTLEFEILENTSHLAAWSLHINENDIFVGMFDGLKLYNPDNGETTPLIEDTMVFKLCAIDDSLFALTKHGLIIYSMSERKITHKDTRIHSELSCSKAEAVSSTRDNTYILDKDGNSLKEFEEIFKNLYRFGDDFVVGLNSENQLIQIRTSDFELHPHDIKIKISGKTQRFFINSQGIVFSMDLTGIYAYENHAVHLYPTPDYVNTALDIHDEKLIIGTNRNAIKLWQQNQLTDLVGLNYYRTENLAKRIQNIHVHNDKVYMTTAKGFYVYDFNTKTRSNLISDLTKQFTHYIVAQNDLLAVSTDAYGLMLFNKVDDSVLWHIDKDDTGAPLTGVGGSLFTSPNELIFGDAKALYSVNLTDRTVKKVFDLTLLSGSERVKDIVKVNRKIYISFNAENGNIVVLDDEYNLLSALSAGIGTARLTAHEHSVWASTENGIYVIDTRKDKPKLLHGTDNMILESRPIFYQDRMWVGGARGIVSMPIYDIPYYEPKVVIDKARLNNQMLFGQMRFSLPSKNSTLDIYLETLDYAAPSKLKYRYRLRNESWQPANGNMISLGGMEPGEYKIEISGTNSTGEWSNENISVYLTVKNPWYMEPASIIFGVLLALTLIVVFVTYLISRLRAHTHIRALLRHEVVHHGQTTVQVREHLHQIKALAEANETNALSMIARLSTQSLLETDREHHANHPKHLLEGSFTTSMSFLSEYIHKHFDVEININDAIDESIMSPRMASDMYRVLYELLMTLSVHQQAGQIDVFLRHQNAKLWFFVKGSWNSEKEDKSNINIELAWFTLRKIIHAYSGMLDSGKELQDKRHVTISIPLIAVEDNGEEENTETLQERDAGLA